MAPAGRPANPVPNKYFDKMKERYHTLEDFMEVSRCPLAKETVRRVIYNNQRTSAPVYMIIWKYLGYTPTEIKNMLIEMGEKDFSSLIGENNVILEAWQIEAIELVGKLRKEIAAYRHAVEYLKNMVKLVEGK